MDPQKTIKVTNYSNRATRRLLKKQQGEMPIGLSKPYVAPRKIVTRQFGPAAKERTVVEVRLDKKKEKIIKVEKINE